MIGANDVARLRAVVAQALAATEAATAAVRDVLSDGEVQAGARWPLDGAQGCCLAAEGMLYQADVWLAEATEGLR